jgi:signal transduction histidine kinase/ActR/RegA family two-component response regulator
MRLEIRTGHLAAEHEMLELAQADAMACHIEEREQRLLEREQHTIKEQFFKAANQAKSEFLANMSHEIRTPMTAILGFTDMLLNRLTDQEDLEAVQTIHRNGHHLLAVINDILDLSKIEAGKLDAERTQCSPFEILADVESLMRASAAEKGLSFSLEYRGRIPESIETAPVRLRQILLNLVGNAVKFTERGEVRITARLATAPSGLPCLQIDVHDTGIGMTSEEIERVFDPFTQANSSTTRQFGGSGLGLAICKRLAGMLGGEIRVQSTPGEGSTFTVEVATGSLDGLRLVYPQEPSPKDTGRTSSAISPASLTGRILLVEDGVDNQRLISLILEKAGATVNLATNGREALEAVFPVDAIQARMEPFDVILMDIQMPEMDGHEATCKLREGGFNGPIIALSAHALEHEIQRILEAGCTEYLAKPIRREDLIRAIERNMVCSGTTQK